MANVFDYLIWRGDLRFSQDPPNAVDALVFATLAYLRFEGSLLSEPYSPISLRQAAEEFSQLPDPLQHCRMKNDIELLQAAAQTERFQNVRLVRYREQTVPEQDTQFAAITFLLDDGSAFLAFRGTDNTLVGWKEDFHMSFRQTVPSQILALEYTREIFAEYSCDLRLGGHSKGGNLAVFAAARSAPEVQRWIRAVYNQDGPGFTQYMMGDPGYLAMVPKIHTYVPQSSIIGLMMEHEEPYTIIHSKQVSVMQHDTFNWEVRGKDFVTVEEITPDSRYLDQTLKNWLNDMDYLERSRFVDAMFHVLESGGAESVGDLFHPKNLIAYGKILGSDEKTRKILTEEFGSFVEAARRARHILERTKLLEAASESDIE